MVIVPGVGPQLQMKQQPESTKSASATPKKERAVKKRSAKTLSDSEDDDVVEIAQTAGADQLQGVICEWPSDAEDCDEFLSAVKAEPLEQEPPAKRKR